MKWSCACGCCVLARVIRRRSAYLYQRPRRALFFVTSVGVDKKGNPRKRYLRVVKAAVSAGLEQFLDLLQWVLAAMWWSEVRRRGDSSSICGTRLPCCKQHRRCQLAVHLPAVQLTSTGECVVGIEAAERAEMEHW